MSDVANHSTKCLNTDSKDHEFIILNVQNLAHVKHTQTLFTLCPLRILTLQSAVA